MKNTLKSIALSCTLSCVLFAALSANLSHAADQQAQKKLYLGVLAPSSTTVKDKLKRGLTKFISQSKSSVPIVVEMLDARALEERVYNRSIDLIATNPGQFNYLLHRYGQISSLVSLEFQWQQQPLTVSSGVIVVRHNDASISSLEDLEGKTIGTTSSWSFQGFQAQQIALAESGLQSGIDYSVKTISGSGEALINTLLQGEVDAVFLGSLPFSILRESLPSVNQSIRLINVQDIPTFPIKTSTRIYPGWVLGTLSHIDTDTQKQLLGNLLSLPRNRNNGNGLIFTGVGLPQSLISVDAAQKNAKLPPYERNNEDLFETVWEDHTVILLITAGFLLLLLAATGVMAGLALRLRAARDKIETENEKFSDLLSNASDGIITVDLQGMIETVNPRLCQIFGYEVEEMVGQHLNMIIPTNIKPMHQKYLEGSTDLTHKVMLSRDRIVHGLKKNGSMIPVKIVISRYMTSSGMRFSAFVNDVTTELEAEIKRRRQEFYDLTTGLPNRFGLDSFLDNARELIDTNEIQIIHMIALRLADATELQATFGSDTVEGVMKSIGRSLRDLSDMPDMSSRTDPSTFILVYSDGRRSDYDHVMNIRDELERTLVNLEGLQLRPKLIASSIDFPFQGTTLNELLTGLDVALGQAADSKNRPYVPFDLSMIQNTKQRVQLIQDLEIGLERNEFEIFVQPQIDLRTGALIGTESLIRWFKGGETFIPPGAFIEVLEQTDLMNTLTDFVLDETLKFNANWFKQTGHRLRTAINMPVSYLNEEGLAEHIQEKLNEYDVPANSLEMEITETSLMENIKESTDRINQIRNLGVEVALDDFGTGYSSLSYLKELPIDRLKIDQSFVRKMSEHSSDETLVALILTAAASFKFETIAEGIEDKHTLEMLADLGCHEGQGYYYSKPIPLSEAFETADKWLEGFEGRKRHLFS